MQAEFSAGYAGGMNANYSMTANVQQPTVSASVNTSGYAGGGVGSVSMSTGYPAANASVAVNAAVPGGMSAGYSAGANGNVSISATVPMPAVSVKIETGGHKKHVKADFSMEIQGYGQVSLNAVSSLPPPPPPPLPTGTPPEMLFTNTAMLTEAEVRQALLNYASSNACYGTDCPKEMTIRNIMPSSALEYVLETFCESRETKMSEEPYKGGVVDGPSFGAPPPPWSIPCQPDSFFHDHKKKIEIPHTSSVRPCHDCGGRGYENCKQCHASGRISCTSCNGSGHREMFEPGGGARMEPCFTCGGDGKNKCSTCGGDGRVKCSDCDGYGQVRNFLKLKVKYHNHKSNYILETTDLPDMLISKVSGVTIFEQTLPQVWPITTYPVPSINAQSQQLVQQHRTAFPTELQLQQRQTLRAVPVTEVHYSWKEHNSRFWVFGTSRAVYSPDYPQQGCCTIL